MGNLHMVMCLFMERKIMEDVYTWYSHSMHNNFMGSDCNPKESKLELVNFLTNCECTQYQIEIIGR